MRTAVVCDDLYETATDFAAVYHGIVERVRTLADAGPVVYAVPGSPLVGRRRFVCSLPTALSFYRASHSSIWLCCAPVSIRSLVASRYSMLTTSGSRSSCTFPP